jgi:uncharacterized membrane protein YidH (DUF202 family)
VPRIPSESRLKLRRVRIDTNLQRYLSALILDHQHLYPIVVEKFWPNSYQHTYQKMSFFSRFSTPVFKNTGSTARDHLASERTYLAWMRTGLGFLALGIGVERFNQLDLAEILPTKNRKRFHEDKTHNDKSDALVGALLGSGAGSIAYGTARYFSNMRLLEQGLFKPAFHGAAFLAVGVAGIAGAVYWSAVRERKAKSHPSRA